MTIVINSLAALERLLGGDEQLEIDVRQGLAAAFAKRYLKGVVDNKVMKDTAEAVVGEVEREYLSVTGSYGWNRECKLTQKGLQALEAAVRTTFANNLIGVIDKVVADTQIAEILNRLIAERVEFISNQLTDAVLTGKIDELVDAKLKEKLGLK